MVYLFVDTTNGLTVGLLNASLEWISYEHINTSKPSEIVHQVIYNLFQGKKLNILESALILAAGPGSYTGMRLGEGVAHIFKLCKLKVVSFYHFEVPQWSEISSGRWVTNAFKKQFFIYNWNENGDTGQIVIDMDKVSLEGTFYSHSAVEGCSDLVLTSQLIFDFPEKVFRKALERNQFFPSYYFRPLEEEFKPIC